MVSRVGCASIHQLIHQPQNLSDPTSQIVYRKEKVMRKIPINVTGWWNRDARRFEYHCRTCGKDWYGDPAMGPRSVMEAENEIQNHWHGQTPRLID
jgi:hypothetical protein